MSKRSCETWIAEPLGTSQPRFVFISRAKKPSFWVPSIRASYSKLQIRACACPHARHRWTVSSGRREQHFTPRVQILPRRFGERRLSSNQITNHLPGRYVERALRRRSHGQRNCALRAEADSPGRRFLARPHSRRLREQKYRDRFLPCFQFAVTPKAEWILQRGSPLYLYSVSAFGPRSARIGMKILSPNAPC